MATRKVSRSRRRPSRAQLLALAPKSKVPNFVPPQLATLVDKAPASDDWLHEIKLDGYRGQLRVADGRSRFLTRKGIDWSDRFGPIVAAAAALPVKDALIDGEAVVLNKAGIRSFGELQDALSEGRTRDMIYFAFDLLHLDGHDLRAVALEERKRLLLDLVGTKNRSPIQYSEHMADDGAKFFKHACGAGLEGIVSKRRGAPYRSGRGNDWLKIKCTKRQELVVGGWKPYANLTRAIGSMLVGYFKDDKFIYAGGVGTGLNEVSARDLAKRLKGLKRDAMPFQDVPRADQKGATWVEPRVVIEVEFTEWTSDGRLRHPSFKGVREDKPAHEVMIELPKVEG